VDGDPEEEEAQPDDVETPLLSPARVFRAIKGALDHLKLALRGRPSRRETRASGRRAASFTSETRGREIRCRPAAGLPAEGLAFLPSVQAALLRAPHRRPLRLTAADLRIWVREGRAPLTILLIADVSASTRHFLEPAARVLSILYRDAYRNRDLLGLVAIEDDAVRTVNHPSRNLRVVLGNLTRLVPSGTTPLADALERGLQVLRRERRRQPIFNPLAILLSDGHPEPFERTREDLFEEPVYREVIAAASRYRRDRIPIVVINPAHDRFPDGRLWWGTRLGMRVAEVSRGRYHGIPPPKQDSERAARRTFGRRLAEDAESLRTILLDFENRPVDSFTGR
jgi:magnesium chelatase subunit D